MLIKRKGFPEESDLVLCTVTNIQHNSIFVNIHEYGRQGMITISEIAPGRIRNIRDYVLEGKVVVCKVLSVNPERGYIDLSLRRVTEGQRREKNDEIKQEIRAEKIIEMTAHLLKTDFPPFYNMISEKLLKEYFYIYQAFNDVLNGVLELHKYFDKNIADALDKTLREKIRPKEIIIAGDVSISVWEENGVQLIKDTLIHAQNVAKTGIKIAYLGGGKYRIMVKGNEYKNVEKILKESSDSVVNTIKKHKGKVEYERVKNIIGEASE
jgi:translation initiation factor 2 subunit 1